MLTTLKAKKTTIVMMFVLSIFMLGANAQAATKEAAYADTIKIFKQANATEPFFKNAYGYAVFPNIGKGGLIVGGAYGEGRVYQQGKYVGDSSVSQVTVGFQAGGQAYSQIVFFKDQRAFKDFTSGDFEFGAQANAVAVTAGANAEAGTSGSSVGASGGKNDATVAARYHKGMAVFTIAKGGLMFQATIGGQTFTYTPLNK